MDLANRLLPSIAPDVAAAGSVRENGREPRRVPVGAAELGAVVATTVAELAAAWVSVGVIVPAAHLVEIEAALSSAAIGFATGAGSAPGTVVTLLAPAEAKGLEFDAVVVVEPAAFLVDDQISGGRMLYIALTRAVQELVMVHASSLPVVLQ
jgi:DNA helicase IV